MKATVINDSYYVGFEGEPELVFMYENITERLELRVWNGYFETLLNFMIEQQVPIQNGILHEYYIHEGWYEESPWEIKNIKEAIQLFRSFDVIRLTEDGIKASENIVSMLPALTSDIITFLEQANDSGDRVFIIYD
ncbi:hypothetical protein LQV63_13780 [Paenibacillus profundus]|uniref:Uncharacterized protein n=1 Tax=Paenibacillus profundus TaxID=1173085 RepID=A0ABS8YEF2_9BACL|nr:hypothetical protein [Paenibacillus profundus]MCE5170381.1 hypothetical protein [Paenibacillus profundus]